MDSGGLPPVPLILSGFESRFHKETMKCEWKFPELTDQSFYVTLVVSTTERVISP